MASCVGYHSCCDALPFSLGHKTSFLKLSTEFSISSSVDSARRDHMGTHAPLKLHLAYGSHAGDMPMILAPGLHLRASGW